MKRPFFSFLVATTIAAASLTTAPDARACGGCFHEPIPTETTQVTGHRMIFSISKDETTLWDQISYSGNPSSFAWVLPVKGAVEIGLSSDALFESLAATTEVGVIPLLTSCAGPPLCGDDVRLFEGATTTSTTTGTTSVTVVSQQVVGPYETVVLHSTDPAALADWLTMNGYAIEASFASVIDDYVTEGFDFLALKLVPGQDVSAMQPVRVSTPGASPTLPLRMVAAGVGATTPIALWVLGEGRYEPKNFPGFSIATKDLVWDVAASKSNYATLAQQGYAATNGRGWLTELASPFSPFGLRGPLENLVTLSPGKSGYGDTTGEAQANLSDDLDKLYGKIPSGSLWVTRMHAELSREALSEDLSLGASTQGSLDGIRYVEKLVNDTPCPVYPPCGEVSGGGGGGGCAVGFQSKPRWGLGAIAALLGLGLAARRRRRKS
jgi:hypothetical protein